MWDSGALLVRLEAALAETAGVYVGEGVEAHAYFSGLRENIRRHVCPPFAISAKVMPPGFPDADIGEMVSGACIAHQAGYWLVYQAETDQFYCFWGTDQENLGAHGIFGNPLYCWSA